MFKSAATRAQLAADEYSAYVSTLDPWSREALDARVTAGRMQDAARWQDTRPRGLFSRILRSIFA